MDIVLVVCIQIPLKLVPRNFTYNYRRASRILVHAETIDIHPKTVSISSNVHQVLFQHMVRVVLELKVTKQISWYGCFYKDRMNLNLWMIHMEMT